MNGENVFKRGSSCITLSRCVDKKTNNLKRKLYFLHRVTVLTQHFLTIDIVFYVLT